MPDFLAAAFETLVAGTVFVTALTIGLDTRPTAFKAVLRRRLALAAVVVVNGIVVPVLAFALVNTVSMHPANETGILLCAICACGPLGLKASQIARGDLAWAVSITTLMTVFNVGLLPLWTAVLLRESVTARPGDLLGAMVAFILLPMMAGVTFRLRNPVRATEAVPRLEAASTVTLALAVAAGLTAHLDQVWLTATSWTPVVIVVLLALTGAAGYYAAGPQHRLRSTSMLVTINRATAIALLISSRSFADQVGVLSTVIAFGIMQTITVVSVALIWRGRPTAGVPVP